MLVTGATGGLGRATALAAASAGATVVLLGRKVRALEALYDDIEKLGAPKPAFYPMDLAGATPKDYADLAAAVERECGRLDGLVHAAAHFDSLQPFDQQTAGGMDTHAAGQRDRAVPADPGLPAAAANAPTTRRSCSCSTISPASAMRSGVATASPSMRCTGLASIVHEETESSNVRTHAVLPGPMRTALRRAAYYGEDTMAHPDPAYAAQAVVWLLGMQAREMRGHVLDLR